MRKKDLILQNTQLYDRLTVAELEISRIKKELELRDSKIAEQEEEIERLKTQKTAETPLKALEEKVKNNANLSTEVSYGASVIGKTVVDAAKYCNQIAAFETDEYAKELVNLILGRTEVAKSEILKIVSSNEELESKCKKIDSQYESAVEYFKSIIAQMQ